MLILIKDGKCNLSITLKNINNITYYRKILLRKFDPFNFKKFMEDKNAY